MRALLDFISRLARCESGSALVEATLVLPIAIALMAGAVDFGRAFVTLSTAEKALRDAGRYLTMLPSSAVCGWGLTDAENLAVYGNIAGTGSPIITGWSTSAISLAQPTPDCSSLSTSTIIQLTATVPYTPLMLSAVGINSLSMNAQHEERWIGQ
jgi:hypothetical protein